MSDIKILRSGLGAILDDYSVTASVDGAEINEGRLLVVVSVEAREHLR